MLSRGRVALSGILLGTVLVAGVGVASVAIATSPAEVDGDSAAVAQSSTTPVTEDPTEVAPGEGLISEETGDPRDPSGADPVQAELVAIAQQIYAIVDPTEGARNVTADGEYYGYAGLRIDPDRGVLTLYWVGELQPNIETIVSAPSSVTVAVVSATYTLFEMQDAARMLIESDPGAVQDGVRISLTGPRVQGDGITVEYYTEGGGAVDAYSVEGIAEELVSLPVFAEQVPGPNEDLNARQLDYSPYAGGAGFLTKSSTYCTTGFGVESIASGNEYLLTAYHCFYQSSSSLDTRKPQGGVSWGVWRPYSTRNSPEYDAALIEPNSDDASRKIFYGGIYSTDRGDVTGMDYNTVGEYVCIGGANSGTHCSVLVISKNDFTVRGEDRTILSSVVRGGNSSGWVIAVGGDSGAPVYSVEGGGRSARGHLSQGWEGYEVSCTGTEVFQATDRCYSRVVWVGITSTLDDLGMTLLTS